MEAVCWTFRKASSALSTPILVMTGSFCSIFQALQNWSLHHDRFSDIFGFLHGFRPRCKLSISISSTSHTRSWNRISEISTILRLRVPYFRTTCQLLINAEITSKENVLNLSTTKWAHLNVPTGNEELRVGANSAPRAPLVRHGHREGPAPREALSGPSLFVIRCD